MGEPRGQSAAERLLAVGIFVGLLWLTHLIAFFSHEYAHSVTAWLTGWKENPLALHYGHGGWSNLLLQSDVDENVDYEPIFAAQRGGVAALIAMAGVLFGNGLLYLASRYGYAAASRARRGTLALFFFLLVLMNVGNFISYVPIRTFTTHADMATVEQGLHMSPWWIILLPGIPFLIALVHFEDRLLPAAMRTLFPDSLAWRALLMAVCCVALFGFFGASGFGPYGPIPLALSRVCVWVLLPCSIAIGFVRARRLAPA